MTGTPAAALLRRFGPLLALARRGAAVLLASSELDELLRLTGRIVVMHRGRIAGELSRAEATEERIMHLATRGAR